MPYSDRYFNTDWQFEMFKRGKQMFVCFVALRPKSTAMVMAGRSVHLTTLSPGQT